MSSSHEEEDYIDYSCSTAVERLARDVESLLRSWHVNDGCDRHFSVSTNPNGLTLLRSEKVTWVAMLPHQQSVQMELELALWDGPASRAPRSSRRQSMSKNGASGVPKKNSRSKKRSSNGASRRSSLSNDECLSSLAKMFQQNSALNNYATDAANGSMDISTHSVCAPQEEQEEPYNQHLPKSLQRPQNFNDLTHMSESLFDNFSTLFGIGQHITLTPTNPLMDLGHVVDNENTGSPLPAPLAQLCMSLVGRHQPKQARWVLTQLFVSWMQTALNCAAQNCQCCLPVFGLWGAYPSNTSQNNKETLSALPAWLDATRVFEKPLVISNSAMLEQCGTNSPKCKKKSSKLTFSPKKHKRRIRHAKLQHAALQNAQYSPSIISGQVLPTAQTYANFCCDVVEHPNLLEGPIDRLSTWGRLLMRQCERDNTAVVELSGAKHIYVWSKFANGDSSSRDEDRSAWRGLDPKEYWLQQQQNQKASSQKSQTSRLDWIRVMFPPTPAATYLDEVSRYQSACRWKALDLLEKAQGTSYGWGPAEDPIKAIYATAIWRSETLIGCDGSRSVQALRSYPSPTGHDPSLVDFLDVEKMFHFKLKTFLDHGALEPTLATNQRCVLACMIRTSTLAPLTLLQHILWDEDIIEEWDHLAGNQAALAVANEARVEEATQTLVDVMDWLTCAEEMISSEEAVAIVNEVMNGPSFYAFASPPEDLCSTDQSVYTNEHPLLAPLFQAAPVGRLLSDLFARMAKLKTPCSMAMVWSAFCSELRQRWDAREPLPQMNFVPGLDHSPEVLAERRKVLTIGVKADLAAFLNCSEPDPDDQHCLIGQKLQVFNIGIEAVTSMENQVGTLSFSEESEREVASLNNDMEAGSEEIVSTKDGSSSPIPARATSSVSLSSETFGGPPSKGRPLESTHGGKITNLSSLKSLQLPKDLFQHSRRKNGSLIDGLLSTQLLTQDEAIDECGSTGSDSMSLEFFDAEECAVSVFPGQASLFMQNVTTTVVHRIERKGARCPLHGRSLVASGDQMYAPYLQRPEPLTDDIILERRRMLSEEYFRSEMTHKDARVPIQKRLEIACRLQKPRLLSDMKAFKAANPGAIFQDFVTWYGNPGNPLEDYSSNKTNIAKLSLLSGLATSDSVAIKLDKAAEAIHILNETRNFWSSTWDEAAAVPAADQKPLFDIFSTVEMALDYLENMHPANLMSQVMAVNLSNAYFLLVNSAKDTVQIDVVKKLLTTLREQTEKALQLLAEDAGNALRSFNGLHVNEAGSSCNFVSIEAIAACEAVCTSLSEAEVIVALAMSLLHKFPGQYAVVQTILKQADGEAIELKNLQARTHFMDAIRKQQATAGQQASNPKPAIREYVLRNLNDAKPCQLSVRCTDASFLQIPNENDEKVASSVMVALTRSVGDF